MERGKISSQIVEIAREKLNFYSHLYFGSVEFEIRFGNVYRVKVRDDVIVEKRKPKEILESRTKEDLIDMLVGSGDSGGTKNG